MVAPGKGLHEMIGVKPMKRIITVTVLNQSWCFKSRNWVIYKKTISILKVLQSVTLNTEDVSRMTFVVNVEHETHAEQVIKQLNKQIDVLKVQDITDQAMVSRELALMKVASTPASRNEINAVIEPFRATIIDVSRDSLIIQVTGESSKIEALIELLQPYGLKN